MKNYLIIACFCFFALTNCSLDNDNNNQPQVTRVLWNLKNVSGGVAGVSNDFNSGKIVWEFNEQTSKFTVSNTNGDSSIEDGLDSGTYTYSVNEVGSKNYISINADEFGSITVTSTKLIINQNETSTGSASDLYIYTFEKSIILEN